VAILDSVRITALRTAAASAVAARHLARSDASRLFVAGCGTQAKPHIDAIGAVRSVRRVTLFDARPDRARALQRQCVAEGLPAEATSDLGAAADADIVVTCTTSLTPFLDARHVAPGAFVAAVGADNEHKQEIDPCLMAAARVVVDSRAQCIAMGDTRGAIAAGTMTPAHIHGDLAEIVSGRRPGRSRDNEVIIFDSTGVAVEDVAAASAVYQRALRQGRGTVLELLR
jgi:ornithine cyclodeaminase/alanine dehydrogenase-like protein (mu-crystallin family)